MISLYTSPSCTSCRKAKAWLTEHELPYHERNIFAEPLTSDELMNILMHTENGTEDIISTRSRIYSKLNLDFDSLKLDELLSIIEEHPDLLKRPIIMEDKKFQVGFNEEEIHQFIPRKIRKIAFKEKRREMLIIDIQNAEYTVA